MQAVWWFSAALGGYLLGSLSFARLVTRIRSPGSDLSRLKLPLPGGDEVVPVGIYGANAASMILGPKGGLLVVLLDILKVFVPCLAISLLFPDGEYHLLAAVAGLVGHNWPIYHRFRGGRGFAAILGGLLAVDGTAIPVTVAVSLLLGIVVFGSPALAYALWVPLIIPWLWLHKQAPAHVMYALAINLVFLAALIPEIRAIVRLRREGKYGAYMQALLDSSPRWLGMTAMARRMWLFRKR